MFSLFTNLGVPLLLLILGYSVGRYRERRHFASLDAREAQYADMTLTNLKAVSDPNSVRQAALVSGDAVIATDYFKSFAARLRNIVGGEVKAFETLMLRARREAMLRMMQRAHALGANEIWNVRYETSNIRSAGSRSPAVSVEIFAFGTAIVRE